MKLRIPGWLQAVLNFIGRCPGCACKPGPHIKWKLDAEGKCWCVECFVEYGRKSA